MSSFLYFNLGDLGRAGHSPVSQSSTVPLLRQKLSLGVWRKTGACPDLDIGESAFAQPSVNTGTEICKLSVGRDIVELRNSWYTVVIAIEIKQLGPALCTWMGDQTDHSKCRTWLCNRLQQISVALSTIEFKEIFFLCFTDQKLLYFIICVFP